MVHKEKKTFYNLIQTLQKFWFNHGCIILQPLDISVGAGTFHHKTFFNVIGSQKISFAYVQPSRRPSDGRYMKNPNRLQHYYQFQVIIKPAPNTIQDIYLHSLQEIGIKDQENDIRFVEDNWKNPTLGASGLGWEVWLNGMEITQFTYFQQMGGLNCHPASVEITYGLERIAMHIQNKKNIYDIIWSKLNNKTITYSNLFYNDEKQNSYYNFDFSNTQLLSKLFNLHIQEASRLIEISISLSVPAYEHMLHAIHYFNLLDCKKILSTTERTDYILTIRSKIKKIAQKYVTNK
ncbi:glycyl-tRNA synthetase, alpha subunit [Buchnera aphidicola (Cinara tujafilina)]|uniref:Glycine--tRNA ligase alpha subunit n=1 Tax=Buchnera aphidicola (Cinara tujafilina) TaxID=261317 RepID=F7WZ29_9GAMM|nr:glycine--tRNA ligase subunit alpha [Buchnera aphidicola]AEH39679.1 glycyl-tRNA synthetase, alpha subunit [Buchnera aphidicola (Cinara tujafilina)]